MKTLDNLLKQQERLQARIEKLLDRPQEPATDDPDGANVVWFKVKFPGSRNYTYAAVQAGGRWYLTGGQGGTGRTWEQLLDYFEDRNAEIGDIWQAASWDEV